jgi:hypothetical protein
MILLAARIVNGKPVYTKPRKELPHGHYVALLTLGEMYGPFQSFEEIGKWSEAPWVSVDSPR